MPIPNFATLSPAEEPQDAPSIPDFGTLQPFEESPAPATPPPTPEQIQGLVNLTMAPGATVQSLISNPAAAAASGMGQAQGEQIRAQQRAQALAHPPFYAMLNIPAGVRNPPRAVTGMPGIEPASLFSRLQMMPGIGKVFRGTQLPYEVEQERTGIEDTPQSSPEAVAQAVRDLLGGFAKPESIALLTTGAGEAQIARLSPGVAKVVRRLIAGYFAKETLQNVVPQAQQAIAPGQTFPQRLKSGLEAGGSALLGAAMGREFLSNRPALTPQQKELYARYLEKTATLHGDVRPQPGEGQGQVPPQESGPGILSPEKVKETEVLLKPGVEANQSLGIGHQIEVLPSFGPNDPHDLRVFGAMGLNEDGTPGKIVVYKRALDKWLSTIPESDRAQAIKTAMAEEGIHSTVKQEEAIAYLNSLTPAEVAVGKKLYLGPLTEEQVGLTPSMLGHELLRQRMQRVLRMEPTEVAEVAGREKWSRASLELIGRIIRRIREAIGTRAAKAGSQLVNDLLDRYQKNLDGLKPEEPTGIETELPTPAAGAPAGSTEDPFMLRRQHDQDMDFARRVIGMSPDQFLTEAKGFNRINLRLGKNASPADVTELRTLHQQATKRALDAMAKAEAAPTPENIQAMASLSSMPQFYNEALKESEQSPAMLRRKSAEKETLPFYLPPVEGGAPPERTGFPTPSAQDLYKVAKSHFLDTSKVPTFEEFQNQASGMYGALPREALFYHWRDAVMDYLMKAPGKELEKRIDDLGIKGKLSTEHQTGFRDIADPVEVDPLHQAQFAQLAQQFPHRKVPTPRQIRERFGPRLRKRYTVIGALADKLMAEAGPAPEKPITRKQVGPEDVLQIAGQSQWHSFTQDEAADVGTVQKFATTGAAVHAGGPGAPPRSVSKMLLAVRDNRNGKIRLLSTWQDPRRGPVVTNPTPGGIQSLKLDQTFLATHKPLAAIPIREPVQHFVQTFADQAEFDKFFGDVGIEGTPGIKTSMFAGPEAGVTELQAGIRTPGPGARPEAGPLMTGAPESPTARELTLPRFARRGVPAEPLPEALPPRPAPQSMLPPQGLADVTRRAAQQFPTMPKVLYRQLANRQVPKEPYRMGAPKSIKEAMQQAGAEKPEDLNDVPGMLRRSLSAADEEFRALHADLTRMVKNNDVEHEILAGWAKTSTLSNNLSRQAETGIRLQSLNKPGGRFAQMFKRWRYGNEEVLAAANPLVEGGGVRKDGTIDVTAVKSKIAQFRDEVAQGRVKATDKANSKSYRERKLGKAWLRACDAYDRELNYADEHLFDRELQQTALRMAMELDAQYQRETDKGYELSKSPDYLPHRYDAQLWDGRSVLFQEVRILGKKFREAKRFKTHYEAISQGPYLPVTRDGASLVAHRLRQGNMMMMRDDWSDGLRGITTPDGKPLAMEPKKMAHERWGSPQVDYEVVPLGVKPGGKPLVIHADFADLISQLTAANPLQKWAVTRGLINLEQQIKHTLLIGDFFHLGRVGYYGASIMGRRFGWNGGWSALDIKQSDMPEAVRRGIIRQQDADWGNAPVRFGSETITRRKLSELFQEQGLEVGKIQDALYKDLVTRLTPSSGPVRKAFVSLLDPSVGRYNRFLFDRVTRGLMMESAVKEFERQTKGSPDLNPKRIMADIARDVNGYFGNLGQQGWLTANWQQDLMRMLFLAPQWVEGLVRKETIGPARLLGSAARAGGANYRQGLSATGTMGYGIGRGLLGMFVLTQAVNLISRRQPTWQNPEKGHKFDGWIPGFGADETGVWLSPFALFNEITHDVYRMTQDKPKFSDVISQIIGNKESPLVRAAVVAMGGHTPTGSYYTSTAGQYVGALKQAVPMPITFGKYARGIGHVLAPGSIEPNAPGAVQRQMFATAGLKVEPAKDALREVQGMARDFVRESGKAETTHFETTDLPSYAKLRNAIANNDKHGAWRVLEELRKQGHDEKQIQKAMKDWSRRPFTGSHELESEFRYSLSDRDRERLSEAEQQRLEQYYRFLDFYAEQP